MGLIAILIFYMQPCENGLPFTPRKYPTLFLAIISFVVMFSASRQLWNASRHPANITQNSIAIENMMNTPYSSLNVPSSFIYCTICSDWKNYKQYNQQYNVKCKGRLQSMAEEEGPELEMIILSNAGPNPWAVMVILPHASPAPITVFHPIPLRAPAQLTVLLVFPIIIPIIIIILSTRTTILLLFPSRLCIVYSEISTLFNCNGVDGLIARIIAGGHHAVSIGNQQQYKWNDEDGVVLQIVVVVDQEEHHYYLYGEVDQIAGEGCTLCI